MTIRTPLPIGKTLEGQRDSYARLALVSHRRHADRIDDDGETLMVSADWLLWQQLASEGRPCLFLEQGLAPGADVQTLSEDILLRANDWAYDNDRDVTEFKSVSLGRAFCTDVTFFMATYFRLTWSLETFIRKFNPREIVLFDIWLWDTEVTPDWSRFFIAKDVATRHNLLFIDRFDPLDLNESETPYVKTETAMQRLSAFVRSGLIAVYEATMDTVSNILLRLSRRRKRVLVMIAWNVMRPLMDHPVRGIQAIFHSRALPKKPGTVLRFLRQRFLLASAPATRLNAAEQKELDTLADTIETVWRSTPPPDATAAAVREFVRHEIIATGRLVRMGGEVKKAAAFLDRYRPDRLVLDGVKNAPHYLYLELAHARNIAIDYTWHAPLAPQNLKFDALGCDPRLPPRVDRVLSWGSANDRWLEKIGARVNQVIRIGNPLLGKYTHVRASNTAKPETATALIVQNTTVLTDLKGLLSHQFYHFIATARALKRAGYKRIIMKLHPGIRRGEENYRAIAEWFGLECEIHRFGQFDRFVNAADLIVGHTVSGTALEIAGSGKNFIAFMLNPTTLDRSYLSDVDNIHDDLNALETALSERRYADGDKLLDAFCDVTETHDQAQAFWKALAT